MTPQAKANEIIDKMETVVQPWESNQCALIAVDEIIKSYAGNLHEGRVDFMTSNPIAYWEEVKEEIKKTLE